MYKVRNKGEPPNDGHRTTALRRAWRLEQELVERTGKGMNGWTEDQKQEKRIDSVEFKLSCNPFCVLFNKK